MNLDAWQWAFLISGAFLTGLSKTGLPGLSVLTVAFFAYALPARSSSGALLPLLICGDVFSVAIFHRHADWRQLGRLSPWVLLGIVAGYLALGRIGDVQVQRMMGGILLGMVALNGWRRFDADGQSAALPHSLWFAALTGLAAGFSTMVANAAGPLMVLYFLAIGLPKLAFIGTGAWFFLLVNLVKVPFSAHLGLINEQSLLLDAVLLVPMIPGALLGPVLLRHINQAKFEMAVLVLAVLAAVRLFF